MANEQLLTESPADPGRARAAAYYVFPMVWFGSAPENVQASGSPGQNPPDIDPDQLESRIIEANLPQNLRAQAYRDGLVAFDFSTWAPYIETEGMPVDFFEQLSQLVLRRLALMNAHVACFHTALRRTQNTSHPITALSPKSILSMNRLDPEGGFGYSDPSVAQIFNARFASTYAPSLPKTFDWRIMHRQLTVTGDTVDQSFQLLAALLNHASSERVISLVDLMVRSAAAYGAHDFSQALITAWAVIESLMQEQWVQYVERNREREVAGNLVAFINSHRKQRLIDSSDITASIESEILSLLNEMPFGLYQELSKVRVARNKWIHALTPVSAQSADLALRVAAEMLRLVEQVDLDLQQPLSLQI